jgi:hypothetical protein
VTSAKQRRQQAFLAANRDITHGIPNDWFRSTPFLRYDPQTGEILSSGVMSLGGIKHQIENDGQHFLLMTGDRHNFWVDVEKKKRRMKAACPAVLDGLTLRNVPVPSVLKVTDPSTPFVTEYEIADDTVELEFDYPGTYTVTICSVRHKDGTYEVVYNGTETPSQN